MDKIYTKSGDKGFTTNLLNKKYSKADIGMELQGGIDEINANIGFLRSLLKSNETNYDINTTAHLDEMLKRIQYDLYLIGVEISTEFTKVYVAEDEIKLLEKEIDYMVDKTEPMKSFIYYSGCHAAAFSHTIRTIIRRVERVFVRAVPGSIYPKSYEYVNRLSDYFFAFSRFINELSGLKDEPMVLK